MAQNLDCLLRTSQVRSHPAWHGIGYQRTSPTQVTCLAKALDFGTFYCCRLRTSCLGRFRHSHQCDMHHASRNRSPWRKSVQWTSSPFRLPKSAKQ